jgi:hypothetical protein
MKRYGWMAMSAMPSSDADAMPPNSSERGLFFRIQKPHRSRRGT